MSSSLRKLHFSREGKTLCGTKSHLFTNWNQITCDACKKIILAHPEYVDQTYMAVSHIFGPLSRATNSKRDDDPVHVS